MDQDPVEASRPRDRRAPSSACGFLPWLCAAVFLATALLGVWAAYDPAAAWAKFALIGGGLIAAMGLAWAGRRWGDRLLELLGLACAWLAAGIGAYFLLRADWTSAGQGKFPVLQRAGVWLQTHRPALPLPEDINSNVAAGALAILLPLALAGIVMTWRRGTRPAKIAAAISCLAVVLAGAALLLTSSRGAWLGVAAAAAAGGLWAWRARRSAAPPGPRGAGLLLAAAAMGAAGLFWAAVSLPALGQLLGSVGGVGGAAMGRAALWRDGLALVADYPFTGSGLGSTMMALSSYVLLLHVGFISHMHNLFLQIAIEQGIVGLIAWAALLGAAAWRLLRSRGGAQSVWVAASLASLTALIVYGMVDVGPYASRLAPVMFLPIGCALAAARTDPPHPALPEANARSADAGPAAGLALALIAILALGLLPGTRAAFQANLGALAQTRAELAVYHWPDTPLQDALRRPVAFSTVSDIDLGRAIGRYRAALALNPANAAANRRLGQIELSRGQYVEAQMHLTAANAAAPAQRATRQLLAEAYAIGGEIERAVPLLRTVDLSQGQVSLRTWWYDALGETANAEAVRAAAEEASR